MPNVELATTRRGIATSNVELVTTRGGIATPSIEHVTTRKSISTPGIKFETPDEPGVTIRQPGIRRLLISDEAFDKITLY